MGELEFYQKIKNWDFSKINCISENLTDWDLYERNYGDESYARELQYVRKNLLEEIEKWDKIDMKLVLEEQGYINEFSVTELVHYVLTQYAGIDEKDVVLNRIENGYGIYVQIRPVQEKCRYPTDGSGYGREA